LQAGSFGGAGSEEASWDHASCKTSHVRAMPLSLALKTVTAKTATGDLLFDTGLVAGRRLKTKNPLLKQNCEF
jgi:hypothetical protein